MRMNVIQGTIGQVQDSGDQVSVLMQFPAQELRFDMTRTDFNTLRPQIEIGSSALARIFPDNLILSTRCLLLPWKFNNDQTVSCEYIDQFGNTWILEAK